MKSKRFTLVSFVSIASLLLIQACNSSSGGGGGGVTPVPDNGQSEAGITSLVITVSGTDHTIGFDANREATVDYPYSATALSSVTIKSISLSADVTSDYAGGETISVANDKVIITVTAQDGTEQTYTINLVQAQPNTGADITNLVVTVSETDHTVSFDDARQATINYPYGSAAPATITIKSISLVADATSDYDSGSTIVLTDGKAIITVTAQDGTEQTYTIRLVAEKNSEAVITSLTLKLIDSTSDSSKSISFDGTTTEATIEYQYTQATTPDTIQLTAIAMSAGAIVAIGDATTDGSNNLPVDIAITGANPSVEIVVTAEDGKDSKTYTVTISLTKVDPNSLKEITDLDITMGYGFNFYRETDKDNIAFNADHTATVSHEFAYGFSESSLPDRIGIRNIAVSAGASASVSTGDTVTIDNSQDSRIVTITVTAADGSTQAYTLIFNITIAKNPEANINTLVVTVSGTDHTINFDAKMEATVDYPYGAAPATITIKSISLSADATSDYDSGEAINVANDKAIITVTAQDGSNKAYTIQLVQTAASSEATITSLIVSVSGTDHTVDFDENEQATINYHSIAAPASITIKSISVSAGATSDYDSGEAISVSSNDQVTITVTAQDGTTEQEYTIQLVYTAASSEAAITSLTLAVSGLVQDIAFDTNRQASAYYPYGDSTPDSVVTIKSIIISADATADYDSGDTISSLTGGKLTIKVTAQDGTTEQEYNITFVQQSHPSLLNILNGGDIGTVPADLSVYDELTKAVLAPYSANANLVARYVTIAGGAITTQGGTSWADAAPASQLKQILDGISDAGADKVYLILVASGAAADASYDAGLEMKMKNHVAIIGGWDAIGGWGRSGTTVLSGGGSHRVFNNDYRLSSSLDSTALLYGLTIAAGSSTGNGGGMRNSYSSPTLSNITLSANSADYGGGIYNNQSSPNMSNITLSANSAARNGGAIYNNQSSPSMSNITLSANSATNSGGGIYNVDSSPSMSNITLSANSAQNGGGIYNGNSSPSMSNITLSANEAANNGGAIYNSDSSPSMSNITLSANSAQLGGGIYNTYSSPSMSNITLSANEATSGGAIYNTNSSSTIINATFAGNKATGSGGGIYIQNRRATTIVGSIFWDNTATNGAQIRIKEATGDTITLAYSVIEGGAPANVTTSTNLVTDNPSLADLTTDTGSSLATMAISTSSSAVNKGVYVRRLDYTDQSDDAQTAWYYSEDNSNWYAGFDSSGLTDSTSDTAAEAEGSIDVTATDATGTARSDRPDAGAYEARQ